VNGLRIQAELARLYERHRVAQTTRPAPLPLLPECDEERVLMCGFASVPVPDLDRCKITGLSFDPRRLPPLTLNHDDIVCGEVAELRFDNAGRLVASCWVDHREAMVQPAFSVEANVEEIVVRNADRPDFFVEITRSSLTALTLTGRPANPYALVNLRMPEPPSSALYRGLMKTFEGMQSIVVKVREELVSC
jgi:hypothetical protein